MGNGAEAVSSVLSWFTWVVDPIFWLAVAAIIVAAVAVRVVLSIRFARRWSGPQYQRHTEPPVESVPIPVRRRP